MPIDTSYRLGTSQNIAPAGGSVASTAFANTTFYIQVCSTAAVNIRIGNAPVAVATDTLLPPNWVTVLTVSPGQQLAAIGNATVSITELS